MTPTTIVEPMTDDEILAAVEQLPRGDNYREQLTVLAAVGELHRISDPARVALERKNAAADARARMDAFTLDHTGRQYDDPGSFWKVASPLKYDDATRAKGVDLAARHETARRASGAARGQLSAAVEQALKDPDIREAFADRIVELGAALDVEFDALTERVQRLFDLARLADLVSYSRTDQLGTNRRVMGSTVFELRAVWKGQTRSMWAPLAARKAAAS